MADATRCARVIVEELITRGVRDVVLAPGSRSAPLAYEIFEADRIGLLRLHVRIDERSAGFVAIGLARAGEGPVAVVTTSGTAAANLHPAVLEASHSHLPLVLITADRPRSMVHTGANQTTDQLRLFGTAVRADVGLDDRSGDPRSWRFQLTRLLTAAAGRRSGSPGPVHLNVSFSDPLVPDDAALDNAASHRDLVLADSPRADPSPIPVGPQTVLVAGDLPPAAGQALVQQATAAGLPLLAEPSSNARGAATALSTYRLLLAGLLAEEIERVVVFGHPTLSRPVLRLLARDDVEVVVVSPYADWVDPGLNAAAVVDAVRLEPGEPDWLDRWREADDHLRTGLDDLLAAQPELTGPLLAGRLWIELNERDVLVAGSSNPIRDLDLAAPNPAPATVYANRGLSGIDGAVSTAVGVALAVERPTHALLGDLTFLHDSNGLILGPDEPRPDLRIIVANDDGGSIFATLEHGAPAHLSAFERVFGTPHHADLSAVARSFGASFEQIGSADELPDLLAEPPVGIEVVEARIDRAHRRTLDAAIRKLATTP